MFHSTFVLPFRSRHFSHSILIIPLIQDTKVFFFLWRHVNKWPTPERCSICARAWRHFRDSLREELMADFLLINSDWSTPFFCVPLALSSVRIFSLDNLAPVFPRAVRPLPQMFAQTHPRAFSDFSSFVSRALHGSRRFFRFILTAIWSGNFAAVDSNLSLFTVLPKKIEQRRGSILLLSPECFGIRSRAGFCRSFTAWEVSRFSYGRDR